MYARYIPVSEMLYETHRSGPCRIGKPWSGISEYCRAMSPRIEPIQCHNSKSLNAPSNQSRYSSDAYKSGSPRLNPVNPSMLMSMKAIMIAETDGHSDGPA